MRTYSRTLQFAVWVGTTAKTDAAIQREWDRIQLRLERAARGRSKDPERRVIVSPLQERLS